MFSINKKTVTFFFVFCRFCMLPYLILHDTLTLVVVNPICMVFFHSPKSQLSSNDQNTTNQIWHNDGGKRREKRSCPHLNPFKQVKRYTELGVSATRFRCDVANQRCSRIKDALRQIMRFPPGKRRTGEQGIDLYQGVLRGAPLTRIPS